MVTELNLSGADANFSDRLLRIEITGSSEVSCSSVNDSTRVRKRKREEYSNKESSTNGVLELGSYHVKSINLNKKHGEAVLLGRQETELGNGYDNESDWKLISPVILRVKELHICSALLAAKSPFFFKLFSNGMRESEQQHVTLSVDASEEDAVMDLLNFMYTNSLSVTTAPELLKVLMAADKFEVELCMKHCSNVLLNMPMTQDFALLLLELPSSIQAAASVEPLTNAARQFIATRYRDLSKDRFAEMMALPLVGLEAIIASDDLQVVSEDVVYDLVLSWARRHYSVVSERQEILGSLLARFIRFPHMTGPKLKNIMASGKFTHPVKKDLILEALFFKSESQNEQCSLVAKQLDSQCRRFVERAYILKPINTVELKGPRRQCIVYLDLTHKECEGLYPSNRILSQVFSLGGQRFYLSASCNTDPQNMLPCFGLFICSKAGGTTSLAVEYKFLARSKTNEEFWRIHESINSYIFTSNKFSGNKNLVAMPWESFMAETSPYFINGVLHLRAELTICR